VSSVKTAVSIDKDVFEEAERLAGELHVSRSQLVTMALRRLVRSYENRALLDEINASVDALTEEEIADDAAALAYMRQRHRAQLEGGW
jgi:metal-responsive CopG/Arc/MetJ family transcriptional regulator